MEKREKVSRKIPLQVYVSEEEFSLIQAKLVQCGAHSFSAYARKMLVDGFVVHRDFSEVKELATALGCIGGNVNQIARRCNAERSIYADDVEDLKRYLADIKTVVQEHLIKLMREG